MSDEGFRFDRESPEFRQGLELMRRVLGERDAARIEALLDHPLFGDRVGWLFAKTWGALYHGDLLTLRDRALVLIGTDLALGREGPLKDHLKTGLYAGLSPEQLVEAMFQAAMYVGVPALVTGLKTANEVFAGRPDVPPPPIPERTVRTAMKDLGVRLGPINHVAMACADWEKAAKGYAAFMGLKTWRVMEISSGFMERAEYYGEPAEFTWISAFAKLGDTLLELCQPVSGKTVFADFVREHGDGMQHVGDLSHPEPLKVVEAWTGAGARVGNYCNIPGVIELYYVDTREQLGGMFLEVVNPPTYAQIANMGEDVTFD